MAKGTKHITPFSPGESTADKRFNLDMFSHTGVYVMAYRITTTSRLGNICCNFFWCQPARLVCQPLQPGTMQYTIVDDE